jgi:putative PIN family toxin of toxin-antitoxin system
VKVLLDTNVLVAAFATRGLCEDIMRVVLREHELIVGTQILSELDRILKDKLGLPSRKAAAVRSFLQREGTVVDPSGPATWPRNDPDDRWIAAAALEGRAEILVTGDQDLLGAANESPIPIVSPREFWESLR